MYVDVSRAKAQRYRQPCSTERVNVTANDPPILPTNNTSPAGSNSARRVKSSTPAWISNLSKTLQRRSSRKNQQSHTSQVFNQDATAAATAIPPPKSIHWCVGSSRRRTLLHNTCVNQKEEREFIDELCNSYRTLRGWKWYLSMTTCIEIKIVRVKHTPRLLWKG